MLWIPESFLGALLCFFEESLFRNHDQIFVLIKYGDLNFAFLYISGI